MLFGFSVHVTTEEVESLTIGVGLQIWSRVKQVPPAFVMRARAASVNLRAATVIFGISRTLSSSVTVATTTAVSSENCFLLQWCLMSLDSDRGGLLTREATSL